MKFSARVYVDKLKLDNRQSVHVLPCPFHPDEMPSMSINLDKAVFYCHGACAEPRGGGPMQFLLKWARYVDKKPITPIEARAQLRFSHKLIDAKTFRIEEMRKEVVLFAAYIVATFADRAKFIERAIGDIDAYAAAWPKDVDDEVWALLANCHRELTLAEHALQTCLSASQGIKSSHMLADLLPIFAECKRRGWWNPMFAIHIEETRKRQRRLARPPQETVCRVSPSRSSLIPKTNPLSPKRQPIPRRSPIR